MVPQIVFSQLVLIALVWVFLLLYWLWPSDRAAQHQRLSQPASPPQKRSREPKPFAGLTHKPYCDACEQAVEPRPQSPSAPPPRLIPSQGRPRQVDTSRHFCPDPDCAYRGWLGLGNISANGHPNGGSWRQLRGSPAGAGSTGLAHQYRLRGGAIRWSKGSRASG